MDLLKRWIDKIYPSEEEFFNALKNKKLVIYHGVDPTGPQLHLGHSTNYLLLRELQKMGHKVILLIGDFTARVGDPTGKSSTRVALTKEQVKNNFKTYKQQAGKILNFSGKNSLQVKFNSKWLEKMTLKDVMNLLSHLTHGRIITRSMFRERIENNTEIYMHELLYPVLQGYDSVALDVDAEVGGVDQTFNMLVGRDLLKIYRNKEKFVITTPLLENPRTEKKLMSKSEGSYIALDDAANDMFGKIMALPDEVIISCFTLCTEISLEEIEKIKKLANPRDQKSRLAKEIVKMYHGEKAAANAAEEFDKVFKDKELPTEIPIFESDKNNYPVLDLLFDSKMASSKNEAKRLVEGGGVEVIKNDKRERISDWKKEINLENGMIVKVGSRKFIKIRKK